MATQVKPTQQKIHSIDVALLKNLKDISLSFIDTPLTALMGTNGCGKTTVLHALACAYGPLDESSPDYKFPMFFKPSTDSIWSGSSFEITYAERIAQTLREQQTQEYGKAADRWTPRYERRPLRFTRLLSIRDSVPELENIKTNSMIHYNRAARLTGEDDQIRLAAGEIMNRNYTEYHYVNYQRDRKRSIGVTSAGVTYAALSMSAGEQRVFHILEAVFSAPDYSLILIDEIDLFLHQDALQRLLAKLNFHCRAKNKQLVMTTHFPPVARMYRDVSINTLHRTPAKTIFWNGYSEAALRYITGIQEKPLTVFVEDDVAEAIVRRVAEEISMQRFMGVVRFGAASNAFVVGAGLVLSERSLDQVLIVMDGDVQAGKKERQKGVERELTGTEPIRKVQRKALLSKIKSFKPKAKKTPEQMLHQLLHTVNLNLLPPEDRDLLETAHDILNAAGSHDFLNQVITLNGGSRSVVVARLVAIASKANGWKRYTALVRLSLNRLRTSLNIDPLQTT